MIKDFVRKCKPGSAEKAFGTTRRLATRGHRQPIGVTNRWVTSASSPKLKHQTNTTQGLRQKTCTRLPQGSLIVSLKMSNSNVSGSFSDVPDGLRKWSCKVKQPSRLPGCNFDISTRCISQIVENLPIVNSRRQTTTWKLECHPKMSNCGVSASQDNYLQ